MNELEYYYEKLIALMGNEFDEEDDDGVEGDEFAIEEDEDEDEVELEFGWVELDE